jgi:hypothetical protein
VKTVEQSKSKYPPHTRPLAIKPGSYSEYLHQHPEIVDEGLRKMGLDVDEIDKLLLEGWTVEIHLNNFKNATFKKIKKNT